MSRSPRPPRDLSKTTLCLPERRYWHELAVIVVVKAMLLAGLWAMLFRGSAVTPRAPFLPPPNAIVGEGGNAGG